MEQNTSTPRIPSLASEVAQALDAGLSRGDRSAVEQIVRDLVGAVTTEGNTRVVFGEPLALASHRVIPVAMVQIGFGGGMGGSRVDRTGPLGALGAVLSRFLQLGFGGGMGGGIKVIPVGFICERDDQVRFEAIPARTER